MKPTPFALSLVCISLVAADDLAPSIRESQASLNTRRAFCESQLRELARTCPSGAKLRQASQLYRQVRERHNALLSVLRQDLQTDALKTEYGSLLQEADASAIQLHDYLSRAECDGMVMTALEAPPLAELFKLPGLVTGARDWLEAKRGSKTEFEKRKQLLMNGLDGLKWVSLETLLPEGSNTHTKASGTRAEPSGTPAEGLQGAKGLKLEGVLADYRPSLVMETGFHTAPIRQMVASPDGKRLLTASEDKTLRLWDSPTLNLVRTFRVPVANGDFGKLYAAGMSPDGQKVLASGFTRSPKGGSHCVYIFDASTGALLREIPGFPQVITHLSVSPKGDCFVAHLGGKHGIRFHRMEDGLEIARDIQYLAPTYQGTFAQDGRYAASSDDGYVRLYDSSFKLRSKARTPLATPFGLAFHPNGQSLALGYAEGCRVDVLSTKTLFPVLTPEPLRDGEDCGPLSSVAWSKDGQRLLAGGGEDFGVKANEVWIWDGSGKGPSQRVTVAKATLSDLATAQDGSFFVASQDPGLVKIGPDLKVRVQKEASPGQLRLARRGLGLDAKGSVVGLGWRFQGRAKASYSFEMLGVQEEDAPLNPPLLSFPGLQVSHWEDGFAPTLNGQPLSGLESYECVRSLSVARDGKRFVLGTDWCLRSFDAKGQPLKTASLPAACWGLNHSLDGRFLVGALADGTLAYFHPDSLEILMRLYLDASGERWALWNPDGVYAASVGGEELLGWHIQKEGEKPDFFPSHQFRDSHFKPGYFMGIFGIQPATAVAQTNLATQDVGLLKPGQAQVAPSLKPEVLAVRPTVVPPPPKVLMHLPPVLSIRQPRDGEKLKAGENKVQVQLKTSTSEEKPLAFHCFMDGKRLSPMRNLKPIQEGEGEGAFLRTYELKLDLEGGKKVLSIVAQTQLGSSESFERVLDIQAMEAAPQSKAPNLNILSIGVAEYEDKTLNLKYPAKDAKDVVDIFKAQEKRLYGEARIKTLFNEEATSLTVMAAIRDLKKQAGPQDVSVIFFSGHGLSNPDTDSYYFVPYNAHVRSSDVLDTLVDGKVIQKAVADTPGKVILLMDTCHAGNVMGAGKMRGLEDSIKLASFINELTRAESGVTVFSSSTGRQVSLESTAWNNGAFTKALREGLSGKADRDKAGKVSLDMLDRYLRERVSELTKGAQTPVSGKPASHVDFPIAITE